MTIIDSANMRCDGCGATANHPIMSMPERWLVDRSVNPIQHYCSQCDVIQKGSTDFQTIPVPSANIPGTNLCSKCGVVLFSKGCWCDKDNDPVNYPQHYTSHPSGVECIQITEWMNFCIGNAVKYLWRADQKNGMEDLKKARWCIDREIQRRELNNG